MSKFLTLSLKKRELFIKQNLTSQPYKRRDILISLSQRFFDILTTVRLKFSNNVLKQELFITNANVSHYTNYPTSTKGFATFILTFKLSIRSKQKIVRERLCCIASSSSFFSPLCHRKTDTTAYYITVRELSLDKISSTEV